MKADAADGASRVTPPNESDAREYTEAQAIAALERVAKRWPRSLQLFSAAGSLLVVRNGWGVGGDARMTDDDVIARITGIPNDGGDPW